VANHLDEMLMKDEQERDKFRAELQKEIELFKANLQTEVNAAKGQLDAH